MKLGRSSSLIDDVPPIPPDLKEPRLEVVPSVRVLGPNHLVVGVGGDGKLPLCALTREKDVVQGVDIPKDTLWDVGWGRNAVVDLLLVVEDEVDHTCVKKHSARQIFQFHRQPSSSPANDQVSAAAAHCCPRHRRLQTVLGGAYGCSAACSAYTSGINASALIADEPSTSSTTSKLAERAVTMWYQLPH